MSTESDLTLASPKRTLLQFIALCKLRLAHFLYEVPMAPLDEVAAAAVARFEVVFGQVWFEMMCRGMLRFYNTRSRPRITQILTFL
jgi:hypothetical protein